MGETAGLVGAIALLAIAGMHGYWAEGGNWPGRDRAEFAELVVGSDRPPPRLASWAVAALLAVASALVVSAGFGADAWLVRAGVVVVAAVLAIRGAAGLAVSGVFRRSSEFARLDRRIYSPLCLTLAALCIVALVG